MVWSYLSQFWDLITGVAEYPIEFFQNIGLAVAGAIGGFFDVIFHNLNDGFTILVWLGVAFKEIFLSLLSPIIYIFTVLRWFFSIAFSTPELPQATYTFSVEILEVFNTIPYWSILSGVLGGMILLVAGVAMLKLILRT